MKRPTNPQLQPVGPSADPPEDPRVQWDQVFTSRLERERSWTQLEPTESLARIAQLGLELDQPIIDIGGGASRLVDHLVRSGHHDLTVLDVSPSALCQARSRVGHDAAVRWVEADITRWVPERRYAVWHDRAVCHFLVESADLEHYRQIVTDGVAPGGHVIIAAFAPGGPEMCSGLPVRQWSGDQLTELFAEAFDPVSVEIVEHHTPSGGVQPFTWAVLRRRSPAPR